MESTSAAKQVVSVRKNSSFLHLLGDPLKFFRSVSAHDGSLAEIRLGSQRFYVLNDPEMIRDIFVTRGQQFEKFPQGNPKQKLFGSGLLTSEGAAQKAQRRILLPAFHRERLRIYASHMVELVEARMAEWQSGQTIDAAAFMNRLTLQVIGRSFFGVSDVTLLEELGSQLATMLHMVNRFVMPWGDLLMRLPLPSSRRYHSASRELERIVAGLIAKARVDSEDNLLQVLLESRKADGSQLSEQEIRDEIVTMVIAGHETVAVGMTWCLHLLANHEREQQELARMVVAAIGDEGPVVEDYSRLEFLQHVFSESLRLYPPIWIMGRRALEDYSYGNFQASAKSVFLVCMADLHRREEFFQDAAQFKPERWLRPTWPAHAYIPFGAGDRRCVGERFAWMEGVFFLACLLRKWQFEKTGQEPTAAPQLTLHPRGPVLLRVSRRAN